MKKIDEASIVFDSHEESHTSSHSCEEEENND